ncbi:MAG: M23 family metallopeptidase [Rhodospirillales bacterium]
MKRLLYVFAGLALFCAAPARAGEITLDAAPAQGALVYGTAPEGAEAVEVDGVNAPVTAAGRFVFGVGRDQTKPVEIRALAGGEVLAALSVTPMQRTFKIQRIDGLPPKQVTPDPKTLERIGREAALIKAVRARSADVSMFPVAFNWPVTGPVSGVFGSQRILNGKPRSPHRGVDVAAPAGTPVTAPAPGTVRLTHEDMFYTGKTVMLDHGYGVTSIYVHMQSIKVQDGQAVRRGDVIGEVGATGRATGPHLHWGVGWFDVLIDPAPLAGPMPE